MRSLLTRLLLLLFVLSPLRARADTGAVVIVGKSDARARDLAARAVSAALTKADWTLLEKPLPSADTSSIGRCFTRAEPQRCILRVVQGKGIENLAYVSVDPDATRGERVLKLTGRIITSKLDLVMIATRFSEHCTDDTLASSAADLMKDLLDRIALSSGRTVLSVKSSPQGARYAVDGTFVGITDASIDVTPGPHTVTVELDGFETIVRSVQAVEGNTAEVSVPLRRPGGEVPPASGANRPTDPSNAGTEATPIEVQVDEPRPSRAAKPLLVIGGLAIAGGIVVLALDQDSATAPRGSEQREFYYDTTTPGLVAIAGGVVVAGVGGYLYWKGTRSPTPRAAVAPTAGGAVMTLSGSF
jgi:hypothetical protein